MTAHDALTALDDLVQSRSILRHPFYQAWRCGRLTRPQLSSYARVYYPHVLAFPSYLRAAIACTSEASIREELERNLRDELSEPRPHAELWVEFAEAFGVDRDCLAGDLHHEAAARIV